jgi:hypothetical protein
LSLKISVISIGSSSTSNNSCPLIPSNLANNFHNGMDRGYI